MIYMSGTYSYGVCALLKGMLDLHLSLLASS